MILIVIDNNYYLKKIAFILAPVSNHVEENGFLHLPQGDTKLD